MAEPLPSAVIIVRQALLADPDLSALTTRISTKDPQDVESAWIRINRSGGIAPVRQRLDGARLDINVYGPDEATVDLIARTAEAALINARNVVVDAGVLTGADPLIGIQDLTDTTRQPVRERRLFSVVAFVHA